MKKVESRGGIALAAVVATLLLLPPPHGAAVLAAAAATTQENNCTRSCGDIRIPYPFGVEPGCYHSSGFNLTCRKHSRGHGPPKLFLGDDTVQVLEISVPDGTVRISSHQRVVTHDAVDGRTAIGTWGAGLPRGGPFFLSEETNNLAAVGCDIQVDLRGGANDDLISSCTTVCPTITGGGNLGVAGLANDVCTGIGCCQSPIILGYSFYNVRIHKFNGSLKFTEYSVYIADGVFKNTYNSLPAPEAVAAKLDWIINNSTCPRNTSAPECRSDHSYCQDFPSQSRPPPDGGYRCQCSDGYRGNPYVTGGCKKEIIECENQEGHSCCGICVYIHGKFQCQCPVGTYGNPFTKGGCTTIKNSSAGLSIGLGVSGGAFILLIALVGPLVTRKIRQHKVKKMKEKYFTQNHGLLLQQLISHNADIGERMIINLKELEKATNAFDSGRIVGGGGHGVVFKGILDLHVVAIKKAKIVVQKEIDEFINEVAVLSQINHRNVVKLLGCCLETEVPLLVYEFVSNGTLYHHLHVEGPLSLPWDERMRIAVEVARALSYLHSAASLPIFHRDIKSSNILLDDTLTAKVSDFGASRYIPIDKTGVTTAVQGTMGYLDPMYYYTGRLTDKSDVFSFGVLLIELLTRKKPFGYRSAEGDGLVSFFVSLLTQGKLNDIIDPQVKEEEEGEVQGVAILAARCTKLKGEDRPTMREVEMTLQNLQVEKQQVPPCISRRNDGIPTQHMSLEPVINAASRQYTMEEEILLSATYPR